jgi:hypothetical protein
MSEHLIFEADDGALLAAPMTEYQSAQVVDWIVANPGRLWTPEQFGWVFFPWMMRLVERVG